MDFKTVGAAWNWLEREVDDPYTDNHRFCYLYDPDDVEMYERQMAAGCCGFFDEYITINGREARIGCNYGH